MFTLEIAFKEGASQPEMLLLRRPQGLIGASDYAHVVIEDMQSLGYQLRVIRDLGRRIICRTSRSGEEVVCPEGLDATYENQAFLDLGPVQINVTALDFDLALKDSEPPDKAGVRILRRACSFASPLFPAVVVRGNPAMVISFSQDQPIFIGRSKHCGLRLDSADISGKHARIGYENGEFWIEDLGSTNGTYVNQQQISGRTSIVPGTPIVLGREVTITGVVSEDQIIRAFDARPETARKAPEKGVAYPVLFSVSEVARPAKLIIGPGCSVALGRDPSCEMWLGAPHVSRRHCTISYNNNGALIITDSSTNGTAYDEGLLKKGESLELGNTPRVLDFGGGVTVAICFNDDQERDFILSNGSPWTFTSMVRKNAPEKKRTSHGGAHEVVEGERKESVSMGVVKQLVVDYRGGSLAGRIVMLAVISGISMILIILISLLLPVFSRL